MKKPRFADSSKTMINSRSFTRSLIKPLASLGSAAVLALSLTGCANSASGPAFEPNAYQTLRGIEPLSESIEIFNLPSVELEEGRLETAFKQALLNSKYVQENAGSIQREDFRDGEFMTYVYAPEAENIKGGYWYLKNDGTSSYGSINTPLILDSENYELPLMNQDKVEEFVEKEFSLIEDNVIVVNFSGLYEFRYTIESGLITLIEKVEDSEDSKNNPLVYLEYGDTEKTVALSNRIARAISSGAAN